MYVLGFNVVFVFVVDWVGIGVVGMYFDVGVVFGDG